jgi:hypothetical protein
VQLVKALAKGVSKPSINKTDFANFLIDSFDSEQQKKMGMEIREIRKKIFDYDKAIQNLEDQVIADINSIKIRN